jgi:hypothetical protein
VGTLSRVAGTCRQLSIDRERFKSRDGDRGHLEAAIQTAPSATRPPDRTRSEANIAVDGEVGRPLDRRAGLGAALMRGSTTNIAIPRQRI